METNPVERLNLKFKHNTRKCKQKISWRFRHLYKDDEGLHYVIECLTYPQSSVYGIRKDGLTVAQLKHKFSKAIVRLNSLPGKSNR